VKNDLTPPSGGGCVGLSRFEGYLVAQVVEALNETSLNAFTAALIEVMHAEIIATPCRAEPRRKARRGNTSI